MEFLPRPGAASFKRWLGSRSLRRSRYGAGSGEEPGECVVRGRRALDLGDMPAPVDNGLLGRGDVGCECLAFGEWRDLVFASPEHEGRHLDRLDNSVDVVFPTGDRFDERVDGVAISGVEFSRAELLDELIGDQLDRKSTRLNSSHRTLSYA